MGSAISRLRIRRNRLKAWSNGRGKEDVNEEYYCLVQVMVAWLQKSQGHVSQDQPRFAFAALWLPNNWVINKDITGARCLLASSWQGRYRKTITVGNRHMIRRQSVAVLLKSHPFILLMPCHSRGRRFDSMQLNHIFQVIRQQTYPMLFWLQKPAVLAYLLESASKTHPALPGPRMDTASAKTRTMAQGASRPSCSRFSQGDPS